MNSEEATMLDDFNLNQSPLRQEKQGDSIAYNSLYGASILILDEWITMKLIQQSTSFGNGLVGTLKC